MNKVIEVKGVQFVNKGAELMLDAIYEKLKDRYGHEFDVALSSRGSPYAERVRYKALQKIGGMKYRFDWSRLSCLIPSRIKLQYGLVDHKDVDVVLDASGYSYGGKWTRSMLRHSVRQAEIMKQKGGVYIFMPQAFGEFDRPGDAKLLERAANAASLIFARDTVSFYNLTRVVGNRENIRLSPDFTNLLGFEDEYNFSLKDTFTVIPNQKMVSSFGDMNQEGYLSILEFVCREARKLKMKIVLLNHEGQGDMAIIESLVERFEDFEPNDYSIISGLDALSIKKKIGESRFLLSSRFHGCVSGLSQEVPTLATSWSHKYEMLFLDYGVDDFIIKSTAGLNEKLSYFFESEYEIRKILRERAAIERNKTKDMWETIFSAIESKLSS